MKNQAGMALGELIITTAVAGLVAATAVAASVPLIAREKLRSATHEFQSTLQVSRAEAVSRNRATRFVFDSDKHALETWDTQGTAATNDDEMIRRVILPDSVSLARPDGSKAVTMDSKDGKYEATFAADGSVKGNTGSVSLHGAGHYTQVSLHAAGGAAVENWTGKTWVQLDGKAEKPVSEKEWDDARDGYEDDWAVKEETIRDDFDPKEDSNDDGTQDDFFEDFYDDTVDTVNGDGVAVDDRLKTDL